MNITRADWERQKLRQLKARLKRQWREPKKKHAFPDAVAHVCPDGVIEISDADYERAAEDAARRVGAAEGFDE